jgi:hypothetical protein
MNLQSSTTFFFFAWQILPPCPSNRRTIYHDYVLSSPSFVLSRKQQDSTINERYVFTQSVPLLSDHNGNWNKPTNFNKQQYKISWISVRWEPSYSTQTSRDTDESSWQSYSYFLQYVFFFSSYVNTPKKIYLADKSQRLFHRPIYVGHHCELWQS